MRLTDKYIFSSFVGPFIGGVAAFLAILLGVSELYWLVRLVVNDGVSLGIVTQVFFLHLPTTLAMTMPMATVFAAVMASAELSNHGEIVAMRAGGLSPWRMSIPVLLAGLAVSLLAFFFNEGIGPASYRRAADLVADFLEDSENVEKSITLTIPNEPPTRRIITSDQINIARREMQNVSIIEFKDHKPIYVLHAEKAVWEEGKKWHLSGVSRLDTSQGEPEQRIDSIYWDMGRSPEDLKQGGEPRVESMTLGELMTEVQRLESLPDASRRDRYRARFMDQHYHVRIATPWAALCFALLGFPLGIRPQRTSAGVGFGIALILVFAYFILNTLLRAFGEQGNLSPMVAAWGPNIVVFGIGLAKMLDLSR